MLGGRVKTLHPRVHAGILARRELDEDLAPLAEQGIEPFDLVCVNLYPFELAVDRPELDEAGHRDDRRRRARRCCARRRRTSPFVTALSGRRTTTLVLLELRPSAGETTLDTRRRLAASRLPRRPRTTPRSRAGSSGRRVPGDVRPGVRPGPRARLRREPAPGGGLLRGARRAHAPLSCVEQLHGKAAVVQQPRTTSRRRVSSPREFDRPRA